MEYSINGLPLNFYYAKAPASTSRSIDSAELADKYGYENFVTGYVDASGGELSSAWGTPTESEYYWSKSFFPLATPESATLPIKDSTTYSRYKEIDIMDETSEDASINVIIRWNGDDSIDSSTLKSNSSTTISCGNRSTISRGDGIWLFIQAPGGGGGGSDTQWGDYRVGGGGGGAGSAAWVWLNAKKLYQNSGTFVISCENWLGGAAGARGVGFTKGADGADVKVFITTNTSSELLLTIEGGGGGGGHAWDRGSGHTGYGGGGGTIIINNLDLFYQYAYAMGIEGCAGGQGYAEKYTFPTSWHTEIQGKPGDGYADDSSVALSPIDDSSTRIKTRTEYSQYYGGGSSINGGGGGGGGSVAGIDGNQGYGYGGRGDLMDSTIYLPTQGGRGIVYLLENSYNYLNAPMVTRKEVITTLASTIIYTVYNPNVMTATLYYKIGEADWQSMSIGGHESKTIETPFRLLLASKFALCTEASPLYPPMTSPIVEDKRSPKNAEYRKNRYSDIK